jgi:CubicO group peptidase (beta-lactamase class C family)
MARWLGSIALAAACCVTRPRGTPQAEVPGQQAAATSAAATPWSRRIDTVMKPWDREDSPGCAVAVIQDREIIHAKGYGMADLEHAVPITPDTVFDIGSTSKQLTAAAVLLAAADGKLRLDDDVRVHVPVLPKLGPTPTTLRHLLHHTGGLRDYGMLFLLSGRRLDGITTRRETLDLLARQRGLDFEPGTKFEYSNSGYFLLAQAVEHATGQPLAAYLRTKVFEPLGMQRTQVLDDRKRIVAGRAIGYTPHGDRWRIEMTGWEQTGPGGVMSTVVDLAKWDANFYEPKVGGRPLLDGLQARGTLADGTPLDYAAGLLHGHYRGQPTVWHAGGNAGYRAQFERFVALKTSVVVLCNASNARPDLLAHEIADIVLADDLVEEPNADGSVFPAVRPSVELSDAELDAWVAMYREVSTGELMAVERTDQALEIVTMGERLALVPTSPRTFRLDPDPVVLEFGGTGPRRTLAVKGPMFEERFVEAELLEPSTGQLAALTGRYRSDEIGTEWTLSVSGRALVATGPVFDEPAVLVTVIEDEYSSAALGAAFRFTRGERGDVTGFDLDLNRMRGIRFDRVP